METISVIIPVYNSELRIAKTLYSILDQTNKNLEIIIVDDGSTDETLSVCRKIADQQDSIRIIEQKNQGVSVARNTGLKYSTGKYISFVDGDDWIEPGMLDYMLNSIKQSNAQICMTNFIIEKDGIHFKSEENLSAGLYKGSSIIEDIVSNMIAPISLDSNSSPIMGSVWRLLIKKDLIDASNIQFNPKLAYMEDLVFSIELFLKADSIYVTDEHHYYYVQSSGSVVSRFNSNLNEQIGISVALIEDLINQNNSNGYLDSRIGVRKVLTAQTLIINELHKENDSKYTDKMKNIKLFLQDDTIENTIKAIETSDYKFRKRLVLNLIKKKSYNLIYLYYYLLVKFVIK